jgi:hypothetical protein
MIEEFLAAVAVLIVGLTVFEIKTRYLRKRLKPSHASSTRHEAE